MKVNGNSFQVGLHALNNNNNNNNNYYYYYYYYYYYNINNYNNSNNNNNNNNKVVHRKLCEKYHLEKKGKWYEHAPDSVSENDEVKLLWDVNIQCDHVIEARRPEIVVENKQEKKCRTS